MFTVTVIGHFGNGKICNDGQTVKTVTVTEELKKCLGKENINTVDTHGSIKTLLKAPFIVAKSFKNSQNIVILPAQNGLRIFAPLISFFKKKNKAVKTHYLVIGGWMPELIKNHRQLIDSLKRFDGIYVEIAGMRKALEGMGFNNIIVMPNCKKLNVLTEKELVFSGIEPYKICTFSRVMKEKGIEDAVETVKKVNDFFGRTVYKLDIYGKVDDNQSEWFDDYKTKFPDGVEYKGVVDFDKSVEIVKDYFFLLFPTRFYTEGVPGTVIDAFAAGVPVVSSKWENFSDVIDDGVNGIGYEFNNIDELQKVLVDCAKNPDKINKMKENCLQKAEFFSPENALKTLIRNL